MKRIESGSVDVILTDPPYLYLKGQKLDRPFDEQLFFVECKRILKDSGFIVLFGRGTSFYRWNTILDELKFTFKEEIIWDKSYCTSPLMPLSRTHETVVIWAKGKNGINRVKVPYLEQKSGDVNSIIQDIKRLKAVFKNTKSLDATLAYLEDNYQADEDRKNKYDVSAKPDNLKNMDRSAAVIHSIQNGMNEKSIIRTDFYNSDRFAKAGVTTDIHSAGDGDRCVKVINSITQGMNEKSIIRETRDHYSAIHPTQKPVRLLERLLALVSKPGDLVCDPFAGSGSTAIACINTDRKFIGFEIDKEYYDASIERINEVTDDRTPKQPNLFQ
ncbi:MAG: DNA-methyltransferase [Mangrovibacterium sp.]